MIYNVIWNLSTHQKNMNALLIMTCLFLYVCDKNKSIPPSATVKCPPINHQILILDVDQVLNPWTRNPNCFIIKRQSSVLVHWWMNHAEFVNVLDALLDVRAIITMISWPCILNFIKPNVEECCPLWIKRQLLCSWFSPFVQSQTIFDPPELKRTTMTIYTSS